MAAKEPAAMERLNDFMLAVTIWFRRMLRVCLALDGAEAIGDRASSRGSCKQSEGRKERGRESTEEQTKPSGVNRVQEGRAKEGGQGVVDGEELSNEDREGGGDGWREEMVVLLVQCSKRAVEVVASQSAAASVVGMEW